MDSLPLELLEEILAKLKTFELLVTCRVVSKSWKIIASLLCRQRRVRLRLPPLTLNESLESFISVTFQPMEASPWSSIFIQPKNFTPSLSTLFSHHLRHLRVTGLDRLNAEGFCDQLSLLQNLQSFEIRISFDYISACPQFLPFESKGRFLALKHLDLKVHRSDPQFSIWILEFLVYNSNLESIHLKIKKASASDIVWISSLLNRIPRISLNLVKLDHVSTEFQSDMFFLPGLLAVEKARLQKLEIVLSELWIDPDVEPFRGKKEEARSYFVDMQKLLEYNSNTLEELVVIVVGSTGTRNLPFNFPRLEKLTSLDISLRGSFEFNMTLFRAFLSTITGQLPKLTHFSAKRLVGQLNFHEVIFPDNCRFDSVRILSLTSNGLPFNESWNLIFRNVTELRIAVCFKNENESLSFIFSFLSLQHLELSISAENGEGTMTILSGSLSSTENNEADIGNSILSLTQLKTLRINFNYFSEQTTKYILNETADVFLKLQPLQHLSLLDADLSEAFYNKLRDHHALVTFVGSFI